jgi:hypothetical protein
MEFPKHWLTVLPFVVLLGAVLVLVPLAKILGRMGFYRGYCLLYFVPFGSLIGWWVVAYRKWPAIDQTPFGIVVWRRRRRQPPLVWSVLYFDFAPFSRVDPRY